MQWHWYKHLNTSSQHRVSFSMRRTIHRDSDVMILVFINLQLISIYCQFVQRDTLKVSKRIKTIFDHRLPDISTRGYSKPASIHECCCSTTTICWPNSNNDWRPTTARSRDIIKGQGRYHTLWTLSLGSIQHSVQSLENTFLQSWIISRFLKCLVVSKITSFPKLQLQYGYVFN